MSGQLVHCLLLATEIWGIHRRLHLGFQGNAVKVGNHVFLGTQLSLSSYKACSFAPLISFHPFFCTNKTAFIFWDMMEMTTETIIQSRHDPRWHLQQDLHLEALQ